MFRMWGKIWKDNHMIKDTVIANGDYNQSRTTMVFQAVEDICRQFDLSCPIWLDSNINDFRTALLNPSTLILWKFMSLKNEKNNKNNKKGNRKSSKKSNIKNNIKPDCEGHKTGIPEKFCNIL